mmetsp:Transcript_49855/g.159380  ORF Transcript_49855/g.159380 Transcript_49855/m.159380 type:complete len:277 (-) Transcript_49855:443-1273(-)
MFTLAPACGRWRDQPPPPGGGRDPIQSSSFFHLCLAGQRGKSATTIGFTYRGLVSGKTVSRTIHAEEAAVGEVHDAEGLVQLPSVDLARLQPAAGERRPGCEGGGGGVELRSLLRVGIRHDPREGGNSKALRHLPRHQHQGRRAVGDGRGVARRDRAALFEGGAEGPEGCQVHRLECLVSLDPAARPPALHAHRHDLPREGALGLGPRRARVALERVGVLVLPRDPHLPRARLCDAAHVGAARGAPKAVEKHSVQQGLVPHPHPRPRAPGEVEGDV